MKLVLIRHAVAGERGPRWPDDRLRPLTSEGAAKMKEAAHGLKEIAPLDLLLTSPLVRARQTAAIVAEAYPGLAVHEEEALATGDNDALLAALRRLPATHVGLVGHEPHLSATLSLLLCARADALAIEFKKGGVALVRVQGTPAAGQAILEAFLPPAVLRGLAR